MERGIVFVLLLVVNMSLFSQNLLRNPGIEAWDNINKPTGWTTAQNCTKDSINKISGSYCCKQEGGSPSKCLAQIITNIVPGKEYELSFYYKTVITGTEHGCRIWCHWEDATGTTLVDPLTDDILEPSEYMNSSSWTQFLVNIIAPESASRFRLEVRTYQTSIAYWDSFVFKEHGTTNVSDEKYSSLTLYPNPASEFIYIDNIDKLQHIDIFDFMGTKVLSSEFSGESSIKIPVSELKSGYYLIRIQESGKLITHKLIIKQ
ncbi:MAG TPA: T9SS type A sorting domain-containing protein [Bacteroidales bacterium]|nr:T9SS type A sorting domain-containing protein [Bacteroidales bacterium]